MHLSSPLSDHRDLVALYDLGHIEPIVQAWLMQSGRMNDSR